MAVRPFVLLALAVGSGALELDLNYLGSVTNDFHNYVSSNLRSIMHEHANPQEAALPDLKNKTTCGECVRDGAKFVIGHTMAKMKEICSNTSNSHHPCITAKVCSMMAKHSDVTLGMMMEHVRPLSLAMAYCYGKGACERPHGVTMDEIAMGEEPHEALLEHFDKVDWSEVEEETEELMPNDDFQELQTEESPPCSENKRMHKVCPYCMKRKMRHVMGFAVKKVKVMCAQTDCQRMQRMCSWMGQHKEVAFGMLAAKVEPWKFAFGACFHPHGHGGHHGGWHHHGHHGHGGGHHHGPQGWWKKEASEEPAIPIMV